MSYVNSVLGPIDTNNLGFTLMHEHLIVSAAGIMQNYPELFGEDLIECLSLRLTQAKAEGINTVVDATTVDLGRDVNILAEVSRRSGVSIIACTGWWLEEPRFVMGVSINQLTQLFVRELVEGISGTNIKAGILKAASDFSGVTEWQETVLRAVARAHIETNAPIMLHSHSPGQIGKRQLAILEAEGVDLGIVKMDHSNDTNDISYLTWLLDQGCYLGMDRYPGQNLSPIERTKTMKVLIDAGYTDRILPSHDCVIAGLIGNSPAAIQAGAASNRANPYGVLYFKRVVIPQLIEMGVSESILQNIGKVGPRSFFEGT